MISLPPPFSRVTQVVFVLGIVCHTIILTGKQSSFGLYRQRISSWHKNH